MTQFGNSTIDYCYEHYDELWAMVQSGNSYSDFLDPTAKMFFRLFTRLKMDEGQPVSVPDLLALGIDLQALCLLVFLIFLKQGNQSISMNESTVTYYGTSS
jgi:hypothetical protein